MVAVAEFQLLALHDRIHRRPVCCYPRRRRSNENRQIILQPSTAISNIITTHIRNYVRKFWVALKRLARRHLCGVRRYLKKEV